MRTFKSWRWMFKKEHVLYDGSYLGTCRFSMKLLPLMGVVCIVMLVIVSMTTNFQYQQTELEERLYPFYGSKETGVTAKTLKRLPRGIIETGSDLEAKPLWSSSSLKSKVNVQSSHNLLAIPVGINQKQNVDSIVKKFLPENFTIILFHYDGNVNGWWNLKWTKSAIHVVGLNQTKWWFAKRFLHPAVVSLYDYIFLWDEDLGVENFDPGRYLDIVRSERLEISQPALGPNSTGIHHRITIRKRLKKFHRRVYQTRGSVKCTRSSEGPPCTGFVEGMAPVFSRVAWRCAWHLIQNDLVHGWGMDKKLGYCVQGDQTKRVGVVDSEYIVHKGIQTLGGQYGKAMKSEEVVKKHVVDVRSEIRRQSTLELQIFEKRWEKATKEDEQWVDVNRNIQKMKQQKQVQRGKS